MRRPDTRFGWSWIARLGQTALVALGLAGLSGNALQAQIMGAATPGTPGAIQGELRGPGPMPPSAPAMTPTLRSADIDLQTPNARRKSGLTRQSNTAARRQLGSGQKRYIGYPGVTPAIAPTSANALPANSAPPRAGTPNEPAAMTPQFGRGSTPYLVAPGLATAPPPVPRRPVTEEDPFAPVGLRMGTLLVKPAIEVDGGYDSNANRSGVAKKGSAFHRTEGEIAAISEWSRHQLDINLRGAYTGYTALDNANRPEGDARITLRLDATRDLNLESQLTARIDTERPNAVNLPGGTNGRTPFYALGGMVGGTQNFGRLSIGIRGTLDRLMYSDADVGGVMVNQDSRNLSTYGLRLRTGYEITPGIRPFVELDVDQRVHDAAVDTGGYRRDSRGTTARLGSTYEIARTLTGETSVGYTFRTYEDSRLGTLNTPVIDSALIWSISPLTTLNLRAQSEIAETTLANSAGATVYRGTATLTHAFLRHFTATATLGLAKTEYSGANRQETLTNAGMRLEYKFSRMLALRGSYTFERFTVNAPNESYNAHAVMLGLRVTP
jgi:hypothetical protein